MHNFGSRHLFILHNFDLRAPLIMHYALCMMIVPPGNYAYYRNPCFFSASINPADMASLSFRV